MTTDDRVAETVAALARACAEAGIPVSIAGLVREGDVSRLLGVCTRTVRAWRYEGTGPAVIRLGGRYWYALHALAAFLSSQEGSGNERRQLAESDMDFAADAVEDSLQESPLQRISRK